MTCGARRSSVPVREGLDGWICDTKSDDWLTGVYVEFQETPAMKECRASGVMSRFVRDELTAAAQ